MTRARSRRWDWYRLWPCGGRALFFPERSVSKPSPRLLGRQFLNATTLSITLLPSGLKARRAGLVAQQADDTLLGNIPETQHSRPGILQPRQASSGARKPEGCDRPHRPHRPRRRQINRANGLAGADVRTQIADTRSDRPRDRPHRCFERRCSGRCGRCGRKFPDPILGRKMNRRPDWEARLGALWSLKAACGGGHIYENDLDLTRSADAPRRPAIAHYASATADTTQRRVEWRATLKERNSTCRQLQFSV